MRAPMPGAAVVELLVVLPQEVPTVVVAVGVLTTVSNPTRLLGHWVRKKGIMPLELAVRRLTFDSARLSGPLRPTAPRGR